MRDILYHHLKQDNQNVRVEQRVSGDTNHRPGDIHHPDFCNGRPTFFDISIRNTMKPDNIASASIAAGSAAAEGELCKDHKFLSMVEAVGGSFVPLVVETFGVWTPYATKMLKCIATHLSLHNGLSASDSYRNLIQQLSVKLWQYNAKLILNYLTTLPP